MRLDVTRIVTFVWAMLAFTFLSAGGPVGCQATRDHDGQQSTTIFEICDLPIPYAGPVRVRGGGRLKDDGLLLADLSCPIAIGNDSLPRTIAVGVERFSDKERAAEFARWLDSVQRPVVQAVVAGNITCHELRGTVPSERRGFGSSGTISCRMDNAVVEKIVRID